MEEIQLGVLKGMTQVGKTIISSRYFGFSLEKILFLMIINSTK